ncbi:MAG: ribosome biogenesis GTPase Der [bacterium]
MDPRPPLIAIVGRPNVGKSTLFNRVIQRRQAVVDDAPGVTRDRIYAHADWSGARFRLVDTGGLVPDSSDPMEEAVRNQAGVAMEEASLILFVADVETGVTDLDAAVADQLRKSERPVLLAVNKVDNAPREHDVHDFHALGLGEPVPISAESGRGTGDLLDRVLETLPEEAIEAAREAHARTLAGEPDLDLEALEEEAAAWSEGAAAADRSGTDEAEGPEVGVEEAAWEEEEVFEGGEESLEAEEVWPAEEEGMVDVPVRRAPLRIAVLGRPNVGKSSFVNTVVGDQRVIVSPEAGTTRDPADIDVELEGQRLTLIDTAGLRRRSRVKENVEYYSALRAIQSLERCDAAILMLDAVEGSAHQDARLLERVLERGKAVVIAVNKWDLVEKETGTAREFEQDLRDAFPFAPFVPIVFMSALTGQRVPRTLMLASEAGESRRRRIPTGRFNRFMREHFRRQEALTPAMGDVRISYAVQAGVEPPTFVFFVNYPKKVRSNFKRFLERRIRESFSLEGTPIRLRFRSKA